VPRQRYSKQSSKRSKFDSSNNNKGGGDYQAHLSVPDLPVISNTSAEDESVSVTTGQAPANTFVVPRSRNAVNTSQNNYAGSYDRTMLDAFTRTAEFEQELKEIEDNHKPLEGQSKRRWGRPSDQYLKKNKTNV